MNTKNRTDRGWGTLLLSGLILLTLPGSALARDIDYLNSEVDVHVTPGEPTQIKFPGKISGGFRKRLSTLSLDRKDSDLIIFASDAINQNGEAIIVRLDDGRSYSLRVKRSNPDSPRDSTVTIHDERGGALVDADEEEAAYQDRPFPQAKATQVAGLMREMVLNAEFGKGSIPGYRVSDRFKGEPILNDGTLTATVNRIFIGPNLWGYELDVANQLDQGQRLNPATFRIDGTRAISMSNWELAARPMNAEQQVAGKHKTKVYVVTRAKKAN